SATTAESFRPQARTASTSVPTFTLEAHLTNRLNLTSPPTKIFKLDISRNAGETTRYLFIKFKLGHEASLGPQISRRSSSLYTPFSDRPRSITVPSIRPAN